MKKTLVALLFASQTAQAQDCEPLFVDIYVSPIPNDPFVEEFYAADTEQKEMFHDRFLLPVEEFFRKEVGVPVQVNMYPAHTDLEQERHIPVYYTTRERLLKKEFPTPEAFYTFAEQRGISRERVQKWEERTRKKHPELSDAELFAKEQKSILDIALGFANPYEQRAYLLSNPLLTSWLFQFHDIPENEDNQASILGGILVHELGHVFGLEHSQRYSVDGKANIMYSGERWMDVPAYIDGDFTLTPKDRKTLQERMCQ